MTNPLTHRCECNLKICVLGGKADYMTSFLMSFDGCGQWAQAPSCNLVRFLQLIWELNRTVNCSSWLPTKYSNASEWGEFLYLMKTRETADTLIQTWAEYFYSKQFYPVITLAVQQQSSGQDLSGVNGPKVCTHCLRNASSIGTEAVKV